MHSTSCTNISFELNRSWRDPSFGFSLLARMPSGRVCFKLDPAVLNKENFQFQMKLLMSYAFQFNHKFKIVYSVPAFTQVLRHLDLRLLHKHTSLTVFSNDIPWLILRKIHILKIWYKMKGGNEGQKLKKNTYMHQPEILYARYI